jgi:hypothetical protein
VRWRQQRCHRAADDGVGADHLGALDLEIAELSADAPSRSRRSSASSVSRTRSPRDRSAVLSSSLRGACAREAATTPTASCRCAGCTIGPTTPGGSGCCPISSRAGAPSSHTPCCTWASSAPTGGWDDARQREQPAVSPCTPTRGESVTQTNASRRQVAERAAALVKRKRQRLRASGLGLGRHCLAWNSVATVALLPFHRCRSEAGADRALSDARSSSRAGVSWTWGEMTTSRRKQLPLRSRFRACDGLLLRALKTRAQRVRSIVTRQILGQLTQDVYDAPKFPATRLRGLRSWRARTDKPRRPRDADPDARGAGTSSTPGRYLVATRALRLTGFRHIGCVR